MSISNVSKSLQGVSKHMPPLGQSQGFRGEHCPAWTRVPANLSAMVVNTNRRGRKFPPPTFLVQLVSPRCNFLSLCEAIHTMSLALDVITDSRVLVRLALLGAIFVLFRIYKSLIAPTKPWPNFPVIKLDGLDAATSWTEHALETIFRGREATNDGFFQIITGNGPKIVAPNRFLEEIKANKDLDAQKGLDAQKAFSTEHFWTYSGMIGFKAMRNYPEPIRHVVRGKVNAAMLAMTKELAAEAVAVIDASMPSKDAADDEWHSVSMQPVCEEIVARLSTLLFLGRDACRDREWLDVVRTYTFNAFRTSARLRACSPIWRPLAHRFWFSESKMVRKQCAHADMMIKPMIEKRQKLIAADCVGSQMLLTLCAVHNTTETMNVAVLDICKNPDVVQPLRNEIVRVLKEEGGWTKNVFSKLHLMDSFLKESQRMLPNNIAPLRRIVTRRTVLSDGTVLPKGAFVTFAGNNMDPSVYPNPDVFDAYRFLRLRGKHNDGFQYTGLSTDMIQFGYGSWACPGRFLAVTELKLALVLFLMEFDFCLDETSQEYVRHSAGANMSNRGATIKVRRRKEKEIDLMAMLE
ncbi:cytochrome P450 [Coccidioides immitis RMSCC 3703]|uniref:Cytochrome P450 n=1 Tax=Coccidioides immitis RMSCC 3703 TaxID=454286 RepID=A0A0J8TF31_COCIT|nr:cytochrome P450 [Coccidioides immitis RMSCC 3703]